MGSLSDVKVRKLTEPGKYGDGHNLWLKVTQRGTKSWVFRFKGREMGLGPYPAVTLATAREKAAEARRQLAAGLDPLEIKRTVGKPAKSITFDEAAETYVEAHEIGWRNPKTARRWRSSIRHYASPVIGKRDVRTITTSDVVAVLKDIWLKKRDTAFKLRGSLDNILAWCAVEGFRDPTQGNPALWRGNLNHTLPPQKRAQNIVSHPAMPWEKLPEFYARLKTREGMSSQALRFIILTVCRASEGLNATRSEVSGDIWNLSRERVKEYRNREVPLVPEALGIIEETPVLSGNPYVFFGEREGRPLSLQSIDNLMERMAPGYTTHGFRSSFKDWSRESTSFTDEITELCLGHKVGDGVWRAYARSTLLAKRRELLQAWAGFCASKVQQPPSLGEKA